jgi:2-C-methyl-D-erythritol 4-phosphate cytidylyltransferase/2-C-methyl-D-erythritol 2,4-cyclodiphosphate synthase
MKVNSIIVAAGKGTRMGGEIPKTLISLNGKPCIRQAVEGLLPFSHKLIVVIRPKEEGTFKDVLGDLPLTFVHGGDTRRLSVESGLNQVEEDCDIVLIHDGARPIVNPDLVQRLIDAAFKTGAAIPAVKVTDTLKRKENKHLETVDRENLYAVQTPQAFKRETIIKAYQCCPDDLTDDAGLVEKMGAEVMLVKGDKTNMKLTTQEDIGLARLYTQDSLRVGMGYDAHRLVEGRKLILCGVEIPYEKGLDGHSDADVCLHALMDAMLGACAMGDIGAHFPDTDGQYKGISSLVLTQKVQELLANKGYYAYNVDITVMAQKPKLLPYIQAMRDKVARALKIPVERVSVKATTTEGLGFVGRGEGIACMAVCTIQSHNSNN